MKVKLKENEIETLEWFRTENPSNLYIFEIKALIDFSKYNEYPKTIELLGRIVSLKPNKLSVIFNDTQEFTRIWKEKSEKMDNIFRVIGSAEGRIDLCILIMNKYCKIANYSLYLSSHSIPIMQQKLLDFRKNIAQGRIRLRKEKNWMMEIFDNPTLF